MTDHLALIGEVRDALQKLSMLNESPVPQQGFEAKVQGGESDGVGPAGAADTSLDYFVSRLGRWIKDANDRVRKERKGQADEDGQVPKLESGQLRYYAIDSGMGTGVPYRELAEKLGVLPMQVRQWRTNRHLNPDNGLPRGANRCPDCGDATKAKTAAGGRPPKCDNCKAAKAA